MDLLFLHNMYLEHVMMLPFMSSCKSFTLMSYSAFCALNSSKPVLQHGFCTVRDVETRPTRLPLKSSQGHDVLNVLNNQNIRVTLASDLTKSDIVSIHTNEKVTAIRSQIEWSVLCMRR
jgi:hypothetical protein